MEAAAPAGRSSAGCWSSRTAPAPPSPPRSRRPRSTRTYDFEAKYIDSTPGIVPAPLTPEETAEVQRLAVEAFDAASCGGPGARGLLPHGGRRVRDQRDQHDARLPPISMYPQMWQASGVSYPELVDRLVQAALRRSTGLR
ncbi:hypothetical protein LV779_36765 [Streptomyces thinghirensis]|nr:hypothetical protein [Streptomyces thinghirensis]